MFELICKVLIKDYDKTENSKVRERYGTVFSIISIILNVFLVIIKLTIASFTGSIAIKADGLNNLSDVGSNVASFVGFRLSNRHSDADHPYGHGRIEYIAGMVISFLILHMGLDSLTEAINGIIYPSATIFTYLAVIILVISIIIKFIMMVINKKAGEKISSATLIAASKDSRNDMITTSATLISLLFFKYTNINIDAYIGCCVSVLVIISGYGIFIGVMSTILGQAPDKELVKELTDYIMSNETVVGIHDLMLHDYGPSKRFMTLHAEVDADKNILEVHDEIDNIERALLEKFNILTTIHMDPLKINDPLTSELKEEVAKIVKDINKNYLIHDFRIVSGPSHINLVFDLLIPSDDRSDHKMLKEEIINKVKKINKGYYCVIEVEHSYL